MILDLPRRSCSFFFLAALVLSNCSGFSQSSLQAQVTIAPSSGNTPSLIVGEPPAPAKEATLPVQKNPRLADVISVQVSGSAGDYQFTVGVSSPDTGCEQYADWWEVVSEQGELIYRRILLHSHVGEQPFVRSGGPVEIDADTVVWVRAHMDPGGYGGFTFWGSVQDGFSKTEHPLDFAANLESTPPLPDGCAF